MNDFFSEYKRFKELLKFKEGEIDFIFPLAIDIIAITYKDKISILKIIASFFSVYNLPKLFKNQQGQTILFTNAYNRSEYSRLVDLVRTSIDKSAYIHLNKTDLVPYINGRNILSSLVFTFRAMRGKTSIKNIFFLASRLAFYRNTLFMLTALEKKKGFSFKKYVAFNGQYGIEALFIQFFKQNRVSTYTLTHGKSYVTYKKKIPSDVINGENIAAQKVLTWGESGRRELIANFSVAPESIVVAGNPNYPLKNLSIKQSFKNGILLLGRKIYDVGNADILAIAGALSIRNGIKFSVRLHPSLSVDYYHKLCRLNNLTLISNLTGLQEMFRDGQYDFAIVNNSTTYYESMYHDMVCFRYEPDENEQYEGLDDKFKDFESLNSRIEAFKNADKEQLNFRVSKLLTGNLGMGINLYKEILES